MRLFQSTHPLRDATLKHSFVTEQETEFQSTHPLRDATNASRLALRDPHDFNPRTPYGMRQGLTMMALTNILFQSTHPLRDATIKGRDIP